MSGPTADSTDDMPLDMQNDDVVDSVIVVEDSGGSDDIISAMKKQNHNNRKDNYINKEIIDQRVSGTTPNNELDDKKSESTNNIKRNTSNLKKNKPHRDQGQYGGEEWGADTTTNNNPPWPTSISKSFKYAAVVTDTIPCSTIGT
jgi:hypothetical protein